MKGEALVLGFCQNNMRQLSTSEVAKASLPFYLPCLVPPHPSTPDIQKYGMTTNIGKATRVTTKGAKPKQKTKAAPTSRPPPRLVVLITAHGRLRGVSLAIEVGKQEA
ncbi:hypothetical protein MTR67_023104 [Solanum verrucosum]|uniref:Uncharacterized protein n=1 Tax=Solanum verrucosum TaxID=315347 RepID=A0AAF0R182_SOLVR|nr:hypothetical protein MTR67_023104 [Solanum verrucosum]